MFDVITNSVKEKLICLCEKLGSVLNQLPEEAKKVKLRVYKVPPWARRQKAQFSNKIHSSEKAKGPAHSETKTFNKPRR